MKRIFFAFFILFYSTTTFAQLDGLKNTYPQADSVHPLLNSSGYLFAFKVKNKWGICNATAQVLLQPKFGWVDHFILQGHSFFVTVDKKGIMVHDSLFNSVTPGKKPITHFKTAMYNNPNCFMLNHQVATYNQTKNQLELAPKLNYEYSSDYLEFDFVNKHLYYTQTMFEQASGPYMVMRNGDFVDSTDANGYLVYPPNQFLSNSGVLNLASQKWVVPNKYTRIKYNQKNILAINLNDSTSLTVFDLNFKQKFFVNNYFDKIFSGKLNGNSVNANQSFQLNELLPYTGAKIIKHQVNGLESTILFTYKGKTGYYDVNLCQEVYSPQYNGIVFNSTNQSVVQVKNGKLNLLLKGYSSVFELPFVYDSIAILNRGYNENFVFLNNVEHFLKVNDNGKVNLIPTGNSFAQWPGNPSNVFSVVKRNNYLLVHEVAPKLNDFEPYYRLLADGTRVDSIEHDANGNMIFDANGNPSLVYPNIPALNRSGVFDSDKQNWVLDQKYSRVVHKNNFLIGIFVNPEANIFNITTHDLKTSKETNYMSIDDFLKSPEAVKTFLGDFSIVADSALNIYYFSGDYLQYKRYIVTSTGKTGIFDFVTMQWALEPKYDAILKIPGLDHMVLVQNNQIGLSNADLDSEGIPCKFQKINRLDNVMLVLNDSLLAFREPDFNHYRILPWSSFAHNFDYELNTGSSFSLEWINGNLVTSLAYSEYTQPDMIENFEPMYTTVKAVSIYYPSTRQFSIYKNAVVVANLNNAQMLLRLADNSSLVLNNKGEVNKNLTEFKNLSANKGHLLNGVETGVYFDLLEGMLTKYNTGYSEYQPVLGSKVLYNNQWLPLEKGFFVEEIIHNDLYVVRQYIDSTDEVQGQLHLYKPSQKKYIENDLDMVSVAVEPLSNGMLVQVVNKNNETRVYHLSSKMDTLATYTSNHLTGRNSLLTLANNHVYCDSDYDQPDAYRYVFNNNGKVIQKINQNLMQQLHLNPTRFITVKNDGFTLVNGAGRELTGEVFYNPYVLQYVFSQYTDQLKYNFIYVRTKTSQKLIDANGLTVFEAALTDSFSVTQPLDAPVNLCQVQRGNTSALYKFHYGTFTPLWSNISNFKVVTSIARQSSFGSSTLYSFEQNGQTVVIDHHMNEVFRSADVKEFGRTDFGLGALFFLSKSTGLVNYYDFNAKKIVPTAIQELPVSLAFNTSVLTYNPSYERTESVLLKINGVYNSYFWHINQNQNLELNLSGVYDANTWNKLSGRNFALRNANNIYFYASETQQTFKYNKKVSFDTSYMKFNVLVAIEDYDRTELIYYNPNKASYVSAAIGNLVDTVYITQSNNYPNTRYFIPSLDSKSGFVDTYTGRIWPMQYANVYYNPDYDGYVCLDGIWHSLPTGNKVFETTMEKIDYKRYYFKGIKNGKRYYYLPNEAATVETNFDVIDWHNDFAVVKTTKNKYQFYNKNLKDPLSQQFDSIHVGDRITVKLNAKWYSVNTAYKPVGKGYKNIAFLTTEYNEDTSTDFYVGFTGTMHEVFDESGKVKLVQPYNIVAKDPLSDLYVVAVIKKETYYFGIVYKGKLILNPVNTDYAINEKDSNLLNAQVYQNNKWYNIQIKPPHKLVPYK